MLHASRLYNAAMELIQARPKSGERPAPELDVIAALASISAEGLRGTVEALAYPRHPLRQAEANARAARWIAEELEALGYAVSFQGELRNVLACPREGPTTAPGTRRTPSTTTS
jgi:hypothetical protein